VCLLLPFFDRRNSWRQLPFMITKGQDCHEPLPTPLFFFRFSPVRIRTFLSFFFPPTLVSGRDFLFYPLFPLPPPSPLLLRKIELGESCPLFPSSIERSCQLSNKTIFSQTFPPLSFLHGGGVFSLFLFLSRGVLCGEIFFLRRR